MLDARATPVDTLSPAVPQVAVLTGGGDRPYALGLAAALISEGVNFDFIGSDDLDTPELQQSPLVHFLNLRGDQNPEAPLLRKLTRVVTYYVRLIHYAATAKAPIFHILWNNKVEFLDRTLVLLYYRLCGKRLVFTVHNVNVRKRDGHDSLLNRLTLKFQYWLVDHLFVHTDRMKQELNADFDVPPAKISVIPFGINSTVPNTTRTTTEARQWLGLERHQRVLLFFGNIAPYKGVEYLVDAMTLVAARVPDVRLVIAGRPKGAESYWETIRARITELRLDPIIVQRIEYVPDAETELYFKAADVLVLPYTHVFQSGVLFLGYNFGLPVIVADVASLKDDVVEGQTGFVCQPRSAAALAVVIERYFCSELYRQREMRRPDICRFANERYSWAIVALKTVDVYRVLAPEGVSSSAR